MNEEIIQNGCVLLARQLLASKIWFKPSEYLKIFTYILLKVNHEGNNYFQKGSNYFNFTTELKQIPGVTKNQVYDFLRWAKSKDGDLITTQKTTRGIVIKLNNYERYQDFKNYKFQHKLQNTSEPSEGKFIKPTLEEVTQYCDERGNNIDPEGFIDYYEDTKWRVGKKKTPMKDWKSTVRTWERNDKQRNKCSGLF